MTKSPGLPTKPGNIAPSGSNTPGNWLRDTDPNAHLQMPGQPYGNFLGYPFGILPTTRATQSQTALAMKLAIQAVWANDTAKLK